jgi:hypothetical protein
VNRFLFFDQEVEKRTLIALGGKCPVKQHINTIMDYTFIWIIHLYEYYKTFGDSGFLRQIYPRAREYMDFCQNKADVDGFVRENPGDWVFIDWSDDLDKCGAFCAEQILYAKALKCFSLICEVAGKNGEAYSAASSTLCSDIIEKFYDEKLGAFIDSFESGKHFISRHSNILAYLFLPIGDELKEHIYANVIMNRGLPPITTPYFEFYENQARCEGGGLAQMDLAVREYYGSMLRTGATTLYEQYDPSVPKPSMYAMYGFPYQKSLCHAWSCSPIYLFGQYHLGVRNTGIAYGTFAVEPQLGALKHFEGTAPLPGGCVHVEMEKNFLNVTATVPGGTLIVNCKRIPLTPNQTVEIKL